MFTTFYVIILPNIVITNRVSNLGYQEYIYLEYAFNEIILQRHVGEIFYFFNVLFGSSLCYFFQL